MNTNKNEKKPSKLRNIFSDILYSGPFGWAPIVIVVALMLGAGAGEFFNEETASIKTFLKNLFFGIDAVFWLKKILIFMLVTTTFLNLLVPQFQRAIESEITQNLLPGFVNEIDKANKSLTAITKNNLKNYLKNEDPNSLSRAVMMAYKAKYNKWHARENGYLQHCITNIEKDCDMKYSRRDNHFTIRVGEVCPTSQTTLDLKDYFYWDEKNTYSVDLDENVLRNADNNTIEYVLNHNASLEFHGHDDSKLNEILDFFKLSVDIKSAKKSFSIDKSDIDIINQGELKSFQDGDIEGETVSKITKTSEKTIISIKCQFRIPLKQSTRFKVSECCLIHKDDTIYSLRATIPFYKGELSFSVPDGYYIKTYTNCSSSLWESTVSKRNPISDKPVEINLDTEQWVHPGLYFLCVWEEDNINDLKNQHSLSDESLNEDVKNGNIFEMKSKN